MNDQFDVPDVARITRMTELTEMTTAGQQVQDEPALLETVTREQIAQSDETTGDQTGGYDSFAAGGLFCVVRTVRTGSTFSTSPSCYDDDYYGSGQLI